MLSKIFSNIAPQRHASDIAPQRHASDIVNEKTEALVPHVRSENGALDLKRPIDIAREKNNVIKMQYKEHVKKQYIKMRDLSTNNGKLYFVIEINIHYSDDECYQILQNLAKKDGYSITKSTYGYTSYWVCYDKNKYWSTDFYQSDKILYSIRSEVFIPFIENVD